MDVRLDLLLMNQPVQHLGRAVGGVADQPGVVDIDQIVDRIGEEGRSAVRRVAGSAGAMNFGVSSLAAPNAASSRTARYSSTARPAASGGRPAAPLDAGAVAGVGLDQAGIDGKAFTAKTRR